MKNGIETSTQEYDVTHFIVENAVR